MAQSGVRDADIGPLRKALAEAERTDESNAASAIERFVELRPGIQDTLESKRHHLLTGRRGTGKSTLLTVVRHSLRQHGAPVAVIDMEKYKGRPFPDVLIEILIALLHEVRPEIRVRHLWADWRLRRRFNASLDDLHRLLEDPQSLTNEIQRTEQQSRNARIAGGSNLKMASPAGSVSGGASLAATGEASRGTTSQLIVKAEFVELKIERLQQVASRLSDELASLIANAERDQAVIFIDDFYYVRQADQPYVLDYLKQVVKSTGIWLKIGGVGARMRPYQDGDPPTGMQPEQDANTLSLDVTLNDFGTAKRFLEQMINNVLRPLRLDVAGLMTDTARDRMVLACGGAVPRDYLTLTSSALDAAIERLSRKGPVSGDTLIRIETEDVNTAARQRMSKKEDNDLELDAGDDAQQLRDRWRDICEFTQAQGNTAFILVRQEDIDKASWGNEIRQLENLRLLHTIRDTVPNAPKWRGVKCMVFMIDLGQAANQRLRRSIPEFWQGTREFDKLRRAEWIYGPEWKTRLALKQKQGRRQGKQAATAASADPSAEDLGYDMPTLFDSPDDLGVPTRAEE